MGLSFRTRSSMHETMTDISLEGSRHSFLQQMSNTSCLTSIGATVFRLKAL